MEGLKPYSALQLSGRDIYIREGCVGCHSQMIRPFRAETERYGHYSVAGEYVYDRPFLWGSKRTGPDLAARRRPLFGRLARSASDESARRGAGVQHARLCLLADRRWTTAPSRPRCAAWTCSATATPREEIADAPKDLEGKTEMDALIAYLQGLGRAMKD